MHLSLRLRIFLFFSLLGLGSMVAVLCGLWLGYRQLSAGGAPVSAFVTAALVSCFGVLGMGTFVWRLFDENLAKPIETLAARFRVQADAGIEANLQTDVETDLARYLGDLAPAATAIQDRLGKATRGTAETVAQETLRLKQQRAQLLRILSDIPIAVIVARLDHQVVLYDGQARAMMERDAPAKLGGHVGAYLRLGPIEDALETLRTVDEPRCAITVTSLSGDAYSGHIRVFEGGAGYTLMLEPLEPDAARPLVYDFDLLTRTPANEALTDKPLRDMAFTVFDSETTGLDPDCDDVVQLSGVRVVNSKVIHPEQFDRLVNPGRPIPMASTQVHHIDDAMVADAPDFGAVRAEFHAFAKGSVLVAHNAPFDMAFLHRGAAEPVFDNLVLDTVHLSAIIFGGSAEHTLDALCARLNISIPEDTRHTGLGDALATARAFAAMLPILEARGLRRFSQVRTEMQKHARLLRVQE